MSAACTTPPMAIIPACAAASATEVGRVIVTSMMATLDAAMMPPVGPAAQARPARKVQTPSRQRKSTTCAPLT